MADAPIEFVGKRILIVRAADALTDELRRQLAEAGAVVLGPMPSTGADIALIEIGGLDGAILDANLDGETAFSLADALEQKGLPFVFVVPPLQDEGRGRYSYYELGRPKTLQIIGQALFGRTSH